MTLDGSARAVAGAVAAVKQDRLWQRHLQIAEIGATGRGGVNRQALTPEDAEARRRVCGWTDGDQSGGIRRRCAWRSAGAGQNGDDTAAWWPLVLGASGNVAHGVAGD